jgi:hypothetical protein
LQSRAIAAPEAAKASNVVASTPNTKVAAEKVVPAEDTEPKTKRYNRKQPEKKQPDLKVLPKTGTAVMEKALAIAKAAEDKEKKTKQERDALLEAKAAKLRAKLTIMKRPSAAAAKAPPKPPSVVAAKAPPKPKAKTREGKDKTEEVVEECEPDDDKEIEGEDGEGGHEAGEEEEKETDAIVEPEDEDSVGHATVIFGVRWGGEGVRGALWSRIQPTTTPCRNRVPRFRTINILNTCVVEELCEQQSWTMFCQIPISHRPEAQPQSPKPRTTQNTYIKITMLNWPSQLAQI